VSEEYVAYFLVPLTAKYCNEESKTSEQQLTLGENTQESSIPAC